MRAFFRGSVRPLCAFLLIASGGSGCSKTQPVSQEPGPRHHVLSSRLLLVAQKTVAPPWDVPEYSDKQSFLQKDAQQNDIYGPSATVWLNPFVAFVQKVAQYKSFGPGGMVVAFVDVEGNDATSPGAPYSDLGLVRGTNCIFIFGDKKDKLAAYVALPNASGDCPPQATANQGVKLDVKTYPVSGHDKQDDYPPAAVFSTGANSVLTIAMRCAEQMVCELGPPGFSEVQDDLNGKSKNVIEERVKLWHDVQRLAAFDGTSLKPTSLTAALIPAPNLAELDLDAFTTTADKAPVVASIMPLSLVSTETSKYKTLGIGTVGKRYEITLRKTGPGDADWEAKLQNPDNGAARTLKFLIRYPHERDLIPGAARWRFSKTDEGLWVRCAQGCCEVDLA